MTEILTESFCERCGTRYTFESSAPRRSRLGRVRTLSKGVRNFVMSDESSFSEAMADARSEEELSATAHQLDAFHQTFNFCLTCRQYTCANCWNAAEGRCLTCAPIPGMEEPAATPSLAAVDGNGHAHIEDDELWPETDLTRLAAVLGEAPASGEATHGSEPDGFEDRTAPAPTPEDVQEPIAPFAPMAPPAGVALDDERAMFAEETAQPVPTPLLGVAPGQSIEDAIAAYERQLDAAASAEAGALGTPVDVPGPTAETPAPLAPHEIPDAAPRQPELAAAATLAFSPVEADESAAGPVGSMPAPPEPMADVSLQPAAHLAPPADVPAPPMPGPPVTPAPEPPVTPSPAPGAPVPATSQAAPPPPPAGATDVIVQPTWPVTTPAPEPVAAPEPGAPPAPPQPAVAPWLRVAPDETEAAPEPQWPAAGAWSVTPNREMPTTLAGRPLLPRDDAAALWAASAQEVLGPAPASQPAPLATAQPCVQCGLSLSANARFCRRCGSRQG